MYRKNGNEKTVAIGAYVSAENGKHAMEEELHRQTSHAGSIIGCDGKTAATIEIRQGILRESIEHSILSRMTKNNISSLVGWSRL